MSNKNTFVSDLLTFIKTSPTPFHACRNIVQICSANDFIQLNEQEAWALNPGKYFYTRGDSSIVAFVLGKNALVDTGARLIGAHTDSPCLKVKPQPEKSKFEYQQINVEKYGGVLLNPWFDRDLSLAGKVTYLDTNGVLNSELIDFQKAIAIIPSLAIHLDREANKNRSVNAQTDIDPILFQAEEKFSIRELIARQLSEQHPNLAGQIDQVFDYNLSFYDTQLPACVGLKEEFIASARLDNLLSCYMGIMALTNASDDCNSVLICNDHEEVGSRSDVGAASTLLDSFFYQALESNVDVQRAVRKSVFVSVDNAHGIHPNFPQKHDEQHGPILNKGPVLKFDANQSYATNSETAAYIRWLARSPKFNDGEIPLQDFVTRSDTRCGSTIGPITAAGVGVRTVDLGAPTFAMHSIRETAGVRDVDYMYRLLCRLFQSDYLI